MARCDDGFVQDFDEAECNCISPTEYFKPVYAESEHDNSMILIGGECQMIPECTASTTWVE